MKLLRKAWADFEASITPEEIVEISSPAAVAVGPGLLIVALLTLGYVPPLAGLSQLSHAWLLALMVAVGMGLTVTAYSRGGRGTLSTLCTLFDNAIYSAALALAACFAEDRVGMALAVVHTLMVVLAPARYYSLTPLFGVAMVTPILVAVAITLPSLPVALVLVASSVMLLMVAQFTRDRKENLLRQNRLEEALGAADKVADESVQTALTSTLLTLGHFLHELRNYQQAIGSNLDYVAKAVELPDPVHGALEDARSAQEKQTELVRSTIDGLRARSSSAIETIPIAEALTAPPGAAGVDFVLTGNLDFELDANPEHLRVVLLNLLRNAEQAGADRLHCDATVEPSGSAILLRLQDDGRGIPVSQRGQLFDSFVVSDKPGGSGLGLYLVRRHVELLGGTIEVSESESPGAGFLLRLPGRRLRASTRLKLAAAAS